jgi:DNA-binding GntR family transcriptional regulator
MAPAEDALVEAPALHRQVYLRLREAILTGELEAGERIAVSALAERFGVSAMPVRDALRQLEQEGIVETSMRRWTRVVALDPALVGEIVPLVSLLEQYAIRTAPELRSASVDEVARANDAFGRAVADGDAAGFIRADTEFHDALVALAGNESLERLLRDARTRIRLLRGRVVPLTAADGSVAEHDEIVAALRAGDRERACAALRRNWERGLDRYRTHRDEDA